MPKFNDSLYNADRESLIGIMESALTVLDTVECTGMKGAKCSDCENRKLCRGIVQLYLTARSVAIDNYGKKEKLDDGDLAFLRDIDEFLRGH